MLSVGSLFSGIGGFDLGLERAGMRIAWQCEQDAYCQRVLARHWPTASRHPDIRRLIAASRGVLPGDCVCGGLGYASPVDVLCGGFPCQDISVAGRGAGIDGERSGLWAEMFRLVCELQPRYVIVENVAALLARGLGRVVGDLAEGGYDAEWDCIPAAAFGAPHRRDRLWLVAYPSGEGRRQDARGTPGDEGANEGRAAQDDHQLGGNGQGRGAGHVADTEGERCGTSQPSKRASVAWDERDPWAVEPAVDRVVDGLPGRVDRVTALGNSLVPQIAQWIGERIMSYEAEVHRRQGVAA